MGKPAGKKKPQQEPPTKANKQQSTSKKFDDDTAVFISMSQELKEEGNKLFHRRDYETAMLRFEKAVKLLPSSHIDVATLRTSMAACYMQMGIGEYPRAISECDLALSVAPKYTKALLRRAICFEALNRLDFAWRDVCLVLSMEPANVLGLEVRVRVRASMVEKGIQFDDAEVEFDINRSSEKKLKIKNTVIESDEVELDINRSSEKKLKIKNTAIESDEVELDIHRSSEKKLKIKNTGIEFDEVELDINRTPEKKVKIKNTAIEFDEAELDINRSPEKKVKMKKEPIPTVIVRPGLKYGKEKKVKSKKKRRGDVIQVKPEDKEVVVQEKVKVKGRGVKLVFGEDIRMGEMPVDCSLEVLMGVVRDRFPGLSGVDLKYKDEEGDCVTITTTEELRRAEASGGGGTTLRLYVSEAKGSVEGWVYEFAKMFKSHVGADSDAYLELHGVGMRLYSEAVDEVATSEGAQGLLDVALDKFQEMAALALFNWGNVHMCKAGKGVSGLEDEEVKAGFDWSRKEYGKAGMRYEEALKMKPDFYEGFLALGQLQFEQAKLCWGFAVRNKVESEESSSSEVLQLFNKAEDNMETGMQMWEETEERRLNGLSKEESFRPYLEKAGLDGLLRELSGSETSEQSKIMRAQVLILWGTLLYERSIIEFKLGLPTWEECLEVAVEKFELAGTSNTDITVIVKNHCAHCEGLGFRIDEIVQAWHDMYDAKRWLLGVPSSRLEPLFRRRVPRLQQVLLEQHM